jgi:ribosomal protein S18 acetylase RimI-like enzyme
MTAPDSAVVIRSLLAADVPAVARLLVAQLREHRIPAREERIESALLEVLSHGEHGFVLVAARDALVVGVAYVSFARPLEHAGEVAWLEELYVSPDERDAGVGTRLVREAVARADARGCVSMELEVQRGHERAANLYTREGFRDLARRHLALPLRAWDWE